jgi:hypothetical protein
MDVIFVARRGVNTNLRAGEIWRVTQILSGRRRACLRRQAPFAEVYTILRFSDTIRVIVL